MSICIFTSVCQEDAGWVPQYLAEVTRLGLPFMMHFDRCQAALIELVRSHTLFQGCTSQDDPSIEFNEQHKQAVFDKVQKEGNWSWALGMDVDETWEKDARFKLEKAIAKPPGSNADLITFRWLNLWETPEYIRIDHHFAEGRRANLYHLTGRGWHYDHPITNGAKLWHRQAKVHNTGIVCLHHGMMTEYLRKLHKDRWDRIYSTALRGDDNPYGFWRMMLDPAYKPITLKHGYL